MHRPRQLSTSLNSILPSSRFGPLHPHPKIASASSSSVKRAAAWERESQKTDSAQWLYKMAGNSRSPMDHTYSKRPKFSMLECRPNSILTKCMFGPPTLVSENRLCEPISIMREDRREGLMQAQVMKRQLRRLQLTVRVRRACNPQWMNLIVTI
jgi:hypothetical protein